MRTAAATDALAKSIVSSIRARVGEDDEDNFSLLADDSVLSDVKEYIPTGFHMLDSILGGGWPVGRASEVFGPEGCGKTALAHRAIKACQDAGGIAALIDAECALDEDKMQQLGIDPDRLIYCTPKHIEQTWDAIWEIIATLEKQPPVAPVLIVWDSIAASVPKDELDDKTTEKSHVGLVARSMSRGCRRMFRAIAKTRAHMLWINQERDAIGGFGPPGMQEKRTAGGNAVKYAASVRLRCQKVQTLKEGTCATGYKIKVQTKKNRLAPPHQKAEFVLDFKYGPSPEVTAFSDFLAMRVIKPSGFRVEDDKTRTSLYAADFASEPFSKVDFITRAKEEEAVKVWIGAMYKEVGSKLVGGSAFADPD